MGLFNFKKSLPVTVAEPQNPTEQLISLMEMTGEQGLAERINDAMQKNMVDTSSYFQAYENADSSGNYFGEEFNIRATAGRIKAAYAKEPWMYATATLIARTLGTVPFMVVDTATGEKDEKHPLNQKLTTSNRFQDNKSLAWVEYLDLVLGGNFFHCFDEFYNQAMVAPVELVGLNMDPNTRTIDSLKLWDTRLGQFGSKTIPYKQVVHGKLPNPYSPFYGLSLFIAASRPLVMDRAKSEFEMAFYLRGATNAGIIETTDDINKTRMERLMRTFEAVYTGKRNWWRTIFLPKGAKWVRSGLTMTEMQHLEGLKENRLTFLAAVGVPPSKVGIVQDVNRATSEIQDETFWVNTIKPLAEFVAGSWNSSYLVKTIYGGRVKVEPDFSGIEALNGNMVSKGEQAKAVESYLTVNEIREDILGYPPLPDERGSKLVVELKPVAAGFGGKPDAPTDNGDSGLPPLVPPVAAGLTDPTSIVSEVLGMKAAVTGAQERIETKLGASYLRGYEHYRNAFLNLVVRALNEKVEVRRFVLSQQKNLARDYINAVQDDLVAAMNRGFSFANAQTKSLLDARASIKTKTKKYRFRDMDQEAIDVLKTRDADGRKTALVQRAIENFVGISNTDTDRVMDMIAAGLEDGKTTDQIAADIREQFTEEYAGQSNTIARTEILSAVSEGIKWNHDVLGKVFSDVQKQWFHVHPDKGSRQNHIGFEAEGPVPSDYKWGNVLEYPRDPNAGAEEVINCRCSMVSVIPDDATSNAEVILDQ